MRVEFAPRATVIGFKCRTFTAGLFLVNSKITPDEAATGHLNRSGTWHARELELELILSQMAQKPMLRGEVACHLGKPELGSRTLRLFCQNIANCSDIAKCLALKGQRTSNR